MVVRESRIKRLKDQHFTRIDILDISIQIGKKLGNDKVEMYFDILGRFFSLKLGKPEFDKLHVAIVGHENIGLHNYLIKSIVKNVCLANAPASKGSMAWRPVIGKGSNRYRRGCLQSLCKDGFPKSPRRGRTPGFCAHRSKDHARPRGPYGKLSAVSRKDLSEKALEQLRATKLLSFGSQPIEVSSVEEGDEVDQVAISPGIHSRGSVTPPLGIPLNGKGNRKVLSGLSSSAVHVKTCYVSCELPDTSSLRKRLEHKLENERVSISLDCVNVLNGRLDVFLKRLIVPSLELASSRIGNKQQNQIPIFASMLDFRTAMELNPQILGEDWPLQLKKVAHQHCEH